MRSSERQQHRGAIDLVQTQCCEQVVVGSLATHELHRLRQFESRLQQAANGDGHNTSFLSKLS